MSKEEVIKELQSMTEDSVVDTAAAHHRADELLLTRMDDYEPEVSKAFIEARKRIGFWYA